MFIMRDQAFLVQWTLIVIFNGTGSPVSLGNYSLRLYYGTGGAYNTVNLSNQTLANNGTWVLVNSGYSGWVSGVNQTFIDNENYTTVVLIKGLKSSI